MPTPGNLKSGDSLFFILPPNRPISLGHEVQTIIIRCYGREGQIIFVSDEIRAKRPQKPNYESKKIGLLRKVGNTQNEITVKLITLFYPGELACMH